MSCRIVAAHDQVICVGEFESTPFPKQINARPEPVPCNLVALNEDVVTEPAEAHLAVVMRVVADELATVHPEDTDGVIQADFIVLNYPTPAYLDCAVLNLRVIFLDDEVLHGHIRGTAMEGSSNLPASIV